MKGDVVIYTNQFQKLKELVNLAIFCNFLQFSVLCKRNQTNMASTQNSEIAGWQKRFETRRSYSLDRKQILEITNTAMLFQYSEMFFY